MNTTGNNHDTKFVGKIDHIVFKTWGKKSNDLTAPDWPDLNIFFSGLFAANDWEWSDVSSSSVLPAMLRVEMAYKPLVRNGSKTAAREDAKQQFLKKEFSLPKKKRKASELPSSSPDTGPEKKARKPLDSPYGSKESKYMKKHVNYALKKKSSIIQSLRMDVENLKTQIDGDPAEMISELNNDVSALKDDIKRIQNQKRVMKCKLNSKVEQVKKAEACSNENEISQLQSKLKSIDEQFKDTVVDNQRLLLENDELREAAQERLFIKTMKDGKSYTTAVNMTVFELSLIGVPIEVIPEAVEVVSKHLLQAEVDGFPDERSCRRMVRLMGQMSKIQVGEKLQDQKHTTLKFDGTSKGADHFNELEISTKEKTFVVGINKLAGGKATDYVQSVEYALSDIGKAAEVATGMDCQEHILSNISNTMTDRVVTNKKTTSILREKKGDQVLNDFYCALHPLDTMAKSANSEISKFEKERGQEQGFVFKHRGESGAQALVQGVGKLFYNDGVGIPNLRNDLADRQVPTDCIPERFVGNRFNILFHNASCIYSLREPLLGYLKYVNGCSNSLHTAVYNDLQNSTYMVACRALGLIDKLVTGPWMQLAEKELNILDMNPHYAHAVEQLKAWKEDPSQLLNGEAMIFAVGTTSVKKDSRYDDLTKSQENDEETKELLKRMCSTLLDVCCRQLVDQLPGGRFSEPSETLREQASSCSATNISGERTFGLLDSLKRRAPNSKVEFIESKIMSRKNDTKTWLSGKTDAELESLFTAARKAMRNAEEVNSQRKKKLLDDRRAALLEKSEDIRKKMERKTHKREDLIRVLMENGGLWGDTDGMESHLKQIKKKSDKMTAVKNQIKVRKDILEQSVPDESLFALRSGNKNLPLETLIENLGQLIKVNVENTEKTGESDADRLHIHEILKNPEILIAKTVTHRWEVQGIDSWYEGEIFDCLQDTGAESKVEFKFGYVMPTGIQIANDGDPYTYLEIDELISDLKDGDLIIHWDL